MRRLLGGLLLATALPAAAAVYTYVDADGSRVFTDQPRAGAKRLQVAPDPRRAAAAATVTAPSYQAPSYQMLRVLIPEPDATLPPSASGLVVTLTSDPALQPGHFYLLYLDGQPVSPPGRSPVFALPALASGTHRLAAAIVDATGRTLERTPSQPLHIAGS